MATTTNRRLIEELQLLTVAELAEICRTGEDWIRRAVAARKYEWTKAGGEIKFTRAQAERIIASLAVKPAHVPTVDELSARRAAV